MRTAHLQTAHQPTTPEPTETLTAFPEDWAFDTTIDPTTDDVRVRGPVDSVTADDLRTVLRLAGRGTSRDLHVDLSQVSILSSAGVRVLYEFPTEHLHLYAPAGTTAQHVLDLVGLPYGTERNLGT